MKLMGLYDSGIIVFPERQAIFARFSSNMLQDMSVKAQAQNKVEDIGFLGRIGEQMRSSADVSLRYAEMTP
jgi:hypothetical protein